MASTSRALRGIGVAFATVSYMKLAAMWLPPKQYAFVSGLLATAAMSGAVFGQAPLAWLIDQFGWQYCLSIVGFAGFALAFLFFMVVRDAPDSLPQKTISSNISFKEIARVFKNKQNWLLTLYSGKIVHGVHQFSLHSYHPALSVLPPYLVIGAVFLLWLKETPKN